MADTPDPASDGTLRIPWASVLKMRSSEECGKKRRPGWHADLGRDPTADTVHRGGWCAEEQHVAGVVHHFVRHGLCLVNSFCAMEPPLRTARVGLATGLDYIGRARYARTTIGTSLR